MHRARRVAAKTLLRLVAADRTSQRVFERRWHRRLMSDREVELAKFFEITDARFVKNVVVTKEVGLTNVALPETIKNWFADTPRAVGDAVDNGTAPVRKLIRIRSVLERQL